MSDDLRAEILRFADVLMKGTRGGRYPKTITVDVVWKLRELAGATPTTGPAPAPEQTNPAQGNSSGTVPQRFQATDMQTNAGPVPAAADRPMPADEKPQLAHTSGWRGVVERAALRCADVDRRNWNLIPEPAREHYRQYGMAMFQALPPHVAGQMSDEPVVPQAPAQPTATRHGLIDATHVVNLIRSTRCTGCNAADPWWCSCPDGYTPPDALAAREDTAPPDEYGDDVRVPGPLAPIDTPIGDFLAEHPEVANARVRVWFCPVHRDGTVDWRGDTAHCTTDDCNLTSTTLKTPDDWSVIDRVTVYDPDGWRRDGKDFSEPITHTEFLRRMSVSTVSHRVSSRRPSAPAVDGDTPTTPTSEEG